MSKTFNQRLRKIILVLILGFIALFVFRLAYGFNLTSQGNITRDQSGIFTNLSFSKRNYASLKYKGKSTVVQQGPSSIDQKYEKIAEIKTKSSKFADEEKSARDQIKQFNALIQFEKKSGNNGNRKLNLVIGVPPENFDALYNGLVTIGKVQAKQITKKDKTNEYKQLNAKKKSLEKIRTSLIELKSKGGKIDEYMSLENRILDIEQQLQDLGVSLGDFDDENEFCTVKFALNEGKDTKISLLHRLKVAFEWTIRFYLQWMAILFFIVLSAYLGLLIIEKLKIFDKK